MGNPSPTITEWPQKPSSALWLWFTGSAIAGCSPENSAPVGQGHPSGIRQFRAVPRRVTIDDDLIAHLQRLSIPALPAECPWACSFAAPVCVGAFLVLNIKVEVDVRICPFNSCNNAFKFDQLTAIEFRGKRMVGEPRARRCQSDDRSQHNKYIPHSNTSRNPDRMQSLAPTVAEVSPSNSRHEMSLPCQSPRPSRATTKCSLEKLHETQSIAEEESGQAGCRSVRPGDTRSSV